ncbi:alpha/beta fold hydrolase [Saccharopolyspora gloriosae]|uniref:alpha/beta fold hydrolase n=1 Tax=Saccharopolyspora gloriosae TaxID=455344 RepID=UPI001FB7084E|nr:alpha/beta fold hydrolase [Saccharopolyspora gloriosae]
MTVYLLVPGANHGGWWYAPLVEALEGAGHTAVAVTPHGLDPDAELPRRVITLDDHVAQAVEALRAVPVEATAEQGRDAVLVGHSYGGSIISGVADAEPDRIRALVYLDALVPEDGDSCWSMTNDEEHAWYISESARTGAFVDPLPFFDERARPHPLATLMQASKLTGAWRRVPVKHYVEATDWPGPSPMAAMTARARADEEFTVHSWETTHNVMAEGPDRVLALIANL